MTNKETDDKPKRDERGYFLPGSPSGPGRPKGSRNAVTMDVKMALMEAFWEIGGVQWLCRLAETEPRTFAMLLAKLIPSEAQDDGERTIRIIGGFTPEDRRTDGE